MPTDVLEKRPFVYVLDEPARLLVVDDDPIIREFASVYLSTPVVEVTTAEDGRDGYDRLVGGGFDLVLCDLDMPRVSGFEFISLVRATPGFEALPIVVATGREDIDSIDAAYRAGATSFVTKPLNWRLLSYQIRYVLRASRGRAG